MGYSAVPRGKLANAVTCLEMTEKPLPREARNIAGLSLERMPAPDPQTYRRLFRAIGEDWLWVSRLVMTDEALKAIIGDPLVEIYVLLSDGRQVGMLELDFRQPGQCELAFFGVTAKLIGTGAGRFLMNRALELSWSRPIARFWVHTCTFDHPSAVAFYQRSGFRACRRQIEIEDDPRLDGTAPRDVARHVPIIE